MMTLILGMVLVVLAGVVMGALLLPTKLVHHYQFENYWFIFALVGLVILPWSVTLIFCPNVMAALGEVPKTFVIKSTLFAAGWGLANTLAGLCVARIGLSLTTTILTGIGCATGVIVPMLVYDPELLSSLPGLVILSGVAVMIGGVIMVSRAAVGREKQLLVETEAGAVQLPKRGAQAGSFTWGLVMCIVAGLLSCMLSFAFVFSREPIMAAIVKYGAGQTAASVAVWAVAMLGGVVPNIGYAVYLLAKNGTWDRFNHTGDLGWSVLMGVMFITSVTLMGNGMLYLGALGASVGFGIQQTTQIMGGTICGFAIGEWRGVGGSALRSIYQGILLLVFAAFIMGLGNYLAQ